MVAIYLALLLLVCFENRVEGMEAETEEGMVGDLPYLRVTSINRHAMCCTPPSSCGYFDMI